MSGVYAYHLLKASVERFGRRPIDLAAEEAPVAQALADNALFIEERILASEEARRVAVSESDAAAARDALAARYEGEAAFREALEKAGVSEPALLEALRRQIRVETVLDAVAAAAPGPSEAEIEAFYKSRPEAFRTPERRRLRQILITVNPDFPENRPEAARARIEAIGARLRETPGRFAEEAQAHSECPSALEGGALGLVARGTLMPPLEEIAFALRPGAISAVAESEIGFHILRCDEVVSARRAPLAEAREQIADALQTALKDRLKRAWIKRLAAARPASGAPKRAITEEAQPCAK